MSDGARERYSAVMSKKRKYLNTYIEFGFTSIVKHVVCYKVIGKGSMNPSSRKWHLFSCHPELANKGVASAGVWSKERTFGSVWSCQSAKSSRAPGYIHGGFENFSTEETTQHWREAHPSMLQRYCSVHDWGWC